MSLGPRPKPETQPSRISRISYRARKAVEDYFKKPAFYLFYGMLALTVLGLFIGLNFAWQYYLILVALCIAENYPKIKK